MVFKIGVHIKSIFNAKAKKWVDGRKNIFSTLEKSISGHENIIWFHCASLGEFEQGRPLIEKLRLAYSDRKILLTFFSPSGYEIQKDYAGADWVFYLPMDGSTNAKRFLKIVQPKLVVFVKYEYWYYYLKNISVQKIPLILISALFKKEMIFFRWYGGLYRKMLNMFSHIFVQTEESKQLINKLGLANKCSVAGDTRFDRVIEVAASSKQIPPIENFIGNYKCIIAGSTWPDDEIVLQKSFSAIQDDSVKLIIAPHEIDKKHIESLQALFPNSLLYSELVQEDSLKRSNKILIIDNIGLLSSIYKYATIAYIGGGLKSSGVHNVLEAAVYGRPVLFGPYYQDYAEAIELINAGGALPFTDEERNGMMLNELFKALLINKEEYEYRCNAAKEFVQANKGATERILHYIQENRLLTN